MLPALRFHITPRIVRVDLDGAGVLLEEEAVLALLYDARSEDAVCVGGGQEALEVPDQVKAAAADGAGTHATMVPLAEVKWYDSQGGFEDPPVPTFPNPWEHHGECVLLHPFTPGEGSSRTKVMLIERILHRIVTGQAAPSLGWAQRAWIRHGARIDVVLPEVPADPSAHDRLVRTLWQAFAWRLRLDGAPARLRTAVRFPLRDWPELAGPFVVAALAVFLAAFSRVHASLKGVVFAACLHVFLFGVTALIASSRFRLGPSQPRVKPPKEQALRAQVGAGPDVDPADFVGVGSIRFEAPHSNQVAAPAMVLLAGLIAILLVWAPHRSGVPDPRSQTLGVIIGIGVVVGLLGSTWLGAALAAPRMSLGERGLTLRLAGWYSRPLLIPYARVRNAALCLPGLVLRLHGGVEFSFATTSAGAARCAEIEAAIRSRLAPAASYRTPAQGCGHVPPALGDAGRTASGCDEPR